MAMSANRLGMPAVGTGELEMKANGKRKMRPSDCAEPGPLLLRPKPAVALDNE